MAFVAHSLALNPVSKYIYVCVCVCVYIYIYTHTHTHTHTYTHTHTHICISLICDNSHKSKFGIFELLVWKEMFGDALLTGIVS